MKTLRYILYTLLILAAAGLLVYQGFIAKNLTSSDLTRGILLIIGGLISMLKKPRNRNVANKKALYQKAYSEFIQEPFGEDPKLEKKFYAAVHDYNRGKPANGLAKLDALRSQCNRTADLRAVTVFTALCLDDLGRYEEALAKYDAARKIRDCSTLASNMGLCCQRLGRSNEAIDHYEEAIQLDSANAIAYNNLSALYFSHGEYESALDAAKDALECDAKLPQALSTAAICCKLLGDDGQYQHYYRRAVAAGYEGEKIKRFLRQMDSSI